MTMRTALWCYVWDVAAEGVEPVLANVQDRAGVQGVNAAVSYHSGMFLLPHNPRHRLYFPQPSIFFVPNRSRYDGLRMHPIVNPLASDDFWREMRSATSRRGMELNAWTVCLHNTGLGTQYPDCTEVNAFGDRHVPQLCPAHPDVRAFVAALVSDLADRDFDAIVLESLEYMPFQHYGFHHEVIGVGLTPVANYLLGLCFCEHCEGEAGADGVDVGGLRRWVRDELQRFFDGELEAGRDGATWADLAALADGQLLAFHRARRRVVTGLFEEVAAAMRTAGGTRLETADFGPLWALGPEGTTFQTGFDPRAVAPYVQALHPGPYYTDVDSVRRKMAEYVDLVGGAVPVLPVMRALLPQVSSAADLAEKMAACQPERVDGFSFYNYGFMRLTALDWIRQALEQVRAGVGA